MLQKIIEQEVRAARAGDWTAILTLSISVIDRGRRSPTTVASILLPATPVSLVSSHATSHHTAA